MKIVHVANGFPPSAVAGVEQYTYSLARQQAGRHDVAIFCREYAPGLAEYSIRDTVHDGLPVRRVVNNFTRVSSLETHYRNPEIEDLFSAFLRETSPDVLHFQHCIGLSAALPGVAAQQGIPVFLTLHDYWYICPTTRLLTGELALCSGPHRGADCRQCLGPGVEVSSFLHRIPFYRQVRDRLIPYGLQRKLLAWIQKTRPVPQAGGGPIPQPFIERTRFMRQMLNSAARLVAPSDFCRQVYVDFGVRSEAIQVLSEGLDLDPWQHVPPRTPASDLRFAYIGALSAHKGVDVLVRAFRELSNRDVQLHVFGSGAPHDPFVKRLKDAAAGDSRIRFHGRYQNQELPQLLAQIDVVVIPSRWHETFSIVTREALLAGVAVLASKVGAISEVISDNVNGLLVPPSDRAALAGALARLADDRALVIRLSRVARATRVKSAEAHAIEIEDSYREILKEKRR